MTIGVSCSAVCTVAVPDAVSATSADASTVSVSPSTTTAGARAHAADGLEEAVVEIRRARDDELTPRHGACESACAGPTQVGQDARHLVARLPGSMATVGADGDQAVSRPGTCARCNAGLARSISG